MSAPPYTDMEYAYSKTVLTELGADAIMFTLTNKGLHMFVQGEMVFFSDRYASGEGVVRYHSARTDRVMIDTHEGETVYIEAQYVDSGA